MITIKLEIATNGIIKTIVDDNYNGADELSEFKTVYETDDDASRGFENTIRFFAELADDLGIDRGNKYSSEVLMFDTDWGTHYEPQEKDLKEKIKELSEEVKLLKEWLKEIQKDNLAKSLIEETKK
jgi:hypothetical protein